uniref:Uncharacterized protein n=1 Tax=Arundo donax TaxID=35708 RepID=A0A0A9HDE2_ARUDO
MPTKTLLGCPVVSTLRYCTMICPNKGLLF